MREREREKQNQGRNYPWIRGTMAPLIFFKYIYIYICVLILAILFYKITFYFPLTISLILLRVMLYSQFSYNIFTNLVGSKFLLIRIWAHHSHHFFTYQ